MTTEKEYTYVEKVNIWEKMPKFIKNRIEVLEDRLWFWLCISMGLLSLASLFLMFLIKEIMIK